MAGEPKGLSSAFVTKEQVEGFLSNLEKLKRDGSITQEQYTIAREEYQQRLTAAIREIDHIKDELKEQLEANDRDIEARKGELARLEASYRTGELPLDQYRSAEQELRAELEGLERDSQGLQRLIRANCSADIGVAAREPQIAAKLPSVTMAVSPEKKARRSRGKLLAAIGGAAVVIGVVVAVLLLGPPWGREEVRFPTDNNGGGVIPSETAEVRIPVNAQGAANVGSLHLELSYDSEVLHAILVEKGEAADANAMLEYSVDSPGRVVIGMISSNGINGNGSLAIVTFEVEGEGNTTTSLELENVVAHDAFSLAELSTTALTGSFATEDHSFEAPILVFIPGES